MTILIVALALSAGSPRAESRTKVAVLDFVVKGLPKESQTTFAAAVAAEIGRRPGFSVISKADIDSMLNFDKQKQALGCSDIACLAEIGGALGVEKIVSGQVTQVGAGQLLASLQLLNTKRAVVESRVSTKWSGPYGEILRVLEMLAQDLILLPAERLPGALQVVSAPEGAEIYADSELKAVVPSTVAKGLPLGVHDIRVSRNGYVDLKRPVVIKNGEVFRFDGKLAEAPSPPVYTRWWFWTVIGAVAAGGVATAVILTRPQDASGTVNVANPFAH